jgi:hypothetical protein
MDKSRTTNFDLIKYAKQLSIPLISIVPKDDLWKMKPIQGAYIFNLGDSTHWICAYLESPSKVAYFDSFGQTAPLAVIDFVRRFGSKKLLESDKVIQNIESGSCGGYCLYFLSFMTHNRHIPFEKRYRMFLNLFHNGLKRR